MRWIVAISASPRADWLDRSLAQMRRLALPSGVEWELLVFRNGSDGRTEEVIARHAPQLPVRRLAVAPAAGSIVEAMAREEADADWIVWTDDDVLTPRNWLVEYARAAAQTPRASFFAGAIEPWFEVPPPRWLTSAWSSVHGAYATRLPGGHRLPISRQLLPHRANLAVRGGVLRELFASSGAAADARCGRWENSDLARRLLDAGHCGYWIPAVRVRRFIPEERLTLNYLDQFFFAAGRTDALRGGPSPLASPRKRLGRAKLRLRALLNRVGFRVSRGLVGPGAWVRYLTKSSYYRGLLAAHPARPVRTIRIGAV